MAQDSLSTKLRRWFLSEGRDLPWRQGRSPYSTWVSEIMLQQTQAVVVIPYYLRWMERFPDVEALALAPWDEVIKLWEGLGYYSRAKRLHEGAKEIVEKFGGNFPKEPGVIKGIGPYTRGAILSFAFHERVGAVDGNIARVMSRLLALEDPVDLPKTKAKLLNEIETLLPEEAPWEVLEAFIELGALVCQKRPKCHLCPLTSNCKAKKEGKELFLPKKQTKVVVTSLIRDVALIEAEGHFLLRRGNEKEVMGYLYEFPYLETTSTVLYPEKAKEKFEELLQIPLSFDRILPKTTHSFTRYKVLLHPYRFSAKRITTQEPYFWADQDLVQRLPFSSGHRQLLHQLDLGVSRSFSNHVEEEPN